MDDFEGHLVEFIFRKIKEKQREEHDKLRNEQIKHRNEVLKVFIDFKFLGISESKLNQKIIEFACAGFLMRPFENKQFQIPKIQT